MTPDPTEMLADVAGWQRMLDRHAFMGACR